MERTLASIYYNRRGPASYSGIVKLYAEAKKRIKDIKLKDVQSWLEKQDLYSLHKPVRTRFPRQSTRVIGYGTTLFSDLASFENLRSKNSNFAWLLVVVEALSRKAYVEPLKHKTAEEVITAFKRIYKRLPSTPFRILTDKGKEYENHKFKEFCKSHRLKHIISTNVESHAWLAERFIRTLKSRLYKYFTNSNTQRWVDVVQDFVDSYNTTVHSTTGVKPNDINVSNEEQYIEMQHKAANKKTKQPRYHVGQTVRIALRKPTFHKGYKQTHSLELYKIVKVLNRSPPVYEIEDENGVAVDATWYEQELAPTGINREKDRTNKYKHAISTSSSKGTKS